MRVVAVLAVGTVLGVGVLLVVLFDAQGPERPSVVSSHDCGLPAHIVRLEGSTYEVRFWDVNESVPLQGLWLSFHSDGTEHRVSLSEASADNGFHVRDPTTGEPVRVRYHDASPSRAMSQGDTISVDAGETPWNLQVFNGSGHTVAAEWYCI